MCRECAHEPSLKHIYLLISSCNTDCTHIVHVLFKKWNTKTGYWVNIWQHVRYRKIITTAFLLFLHKIMIWWLLLVISISSSSSFFGAKYCYYLFMNGSNFCFWLMFCLSLSWFKIVVYNSNPLLPTLKILQSENNMIDKIRVKFAHRLER